MNSVFNMVYWLLKAVSGISGFSYNEVNIIAYYMILPFAYVVLADKILKTHFLKIGYVTAIGLALLMIKDFTAFSDWLFDESVDFLLSFQAVGWNYIVSSVLVCVVFPAIVFVVMFRFAYPDTCRRIRRLLTPRENQSRRDARTVSANNPRKTAPYEPPGCDD